MRRLGLFLIIFLMSSCNVKERPISYGSDECDYCKMIIMDHRYGAELVTQKGKVYTFDAAECLIEYLHHHDEMVQNSRYLLVTSFTEPDQLIDANSSTYLVSKNLPSPMGAYLTSFSSREKAEQFHRKEGGKLYGWDELFKDFRTIKRDVIAQ